MTTASWEFWFGLLEQFVKGHGHACVPQHHAVDGYPLGNWVSMQRSRYAKNTLEADRKTRLQELPGWTWDILAAKWEEGYSRLLDYVESNGHARVPNTYNVDDYPLGQWVGVQRRLRAKGKLDVDRERRLLELNGWVWAAHEAAWEEGFSRALDYVKSHGDDRIPKHYMVDGYPLGNWVSMQRVSYAKGTLDADRKNRLQELNGWIWDTFAAKWEEGYSRLLDYVESNGHARVPNSYNVDGYPLGAWVAAQRAKRAKGKLDVDRERRLLELNDWVWTPFEARWEEGYSRLLEYVESNGDACVPGSYMVDDYPLGLWVTTQRQSYTKGTLDADRKNRLQELNGWTWDTYAASGRRATADYWSTSNPTVMLTFRRSTWSTATCLAHGSACNAIATPKAPLTPIAKTGSRN